MTNSLLLDLCKLNSVFVDKKYKTVTVQPGARWIDVYRAVAPFAVAGPHDGNIGAGTAWAQIFRPLFIPC